MHFYYHRYLFVHGDLCTKHLKNHAIFEDFLFYFIYYYFLYTAFKSSGGFQLAENDKFDLLIFSPRAFMIRNQLPKFQLNVNSLHISSNIKEIAELSSPTTEICNSLSLSSSSIFIYTRNRIILYGLPRNRV